MNKIRETSDAVCEKIIAKANITDGLTLLEPQCGNGKILDYLAKNFTFNGLLITGIELNQERIEEAKKISNKYTYSNSHSFIKGDFLEITNLPYQTYDRIIAAPPFKGNIDVKHIMKQYEFLSKKGIMVTLTSPQWILNNEPHQVEFREWLATKNYNFELLPDNSFIEKGKTVPTGLLTFYKK